MNLLMKFITFYMLSMNSPSFLDCSTLKFYKNEIQLTNLKYQEIRAQILFQRICKSILNEITAWKHCQQERRASQNTEQSLLLGMNTHHTTKNNICFRIIDKELNFFEEAGIRGNPFSKISIFNFVFCLRMYKAVVYQFSSSSDHKRRFLN